MARPKKNESDRRVSFGISVAPETARFLERVAPERGERGLVIDRLVGLVDLIALATATEIMRIKPQNNLKPTQILDEASADGRVEQ